MSGLQRPNLQIKILLSNIFSITFLSHFLSLLLSIPPNAHARTSNTRIIIIFMSAVYYKQNIMFFFIIYMKNILKKKRWKAAKDHELGNHQNEKNYVFFSLHFFRFSVDFGEMLRTCNSERDDDDDDNRIYRKASAASHSVTAAKSTNFGWWKEKKRLKTGTWPYYYGLFFFFLSLLL